MTHPFILERAKVLAAFRYDDLLDGGANTPAQTFDEFWDKCQTYYIAMAQAITDHDMKAGRKVVEREPTKKMRHAFHDSYEEQDRKGNGVLWALALMAAHDAAPAYPQEGRSEQQNERQDVFGRNSVEPRPDNRVDGEDVRLAHGYRLY